MPGPSPARRQLKGPGDEVGILSIVPFEKKHILEWRLFARDLGIFVKKIIKQPVF